MAFSTSVGSIRGFIWRVVCLLIGFGSPLKSSYSSLQYLLQTSPVPPLSVMISFRNVSKYSSMLILIMCYVQLLVWSVVITLKMSSSILKCSQTTSSRLELMVLSCLSINLTIQLSNRLIALRLVSYRSIRQIEICEVSLFINPLLNLTVSYTHLDVYKRQT